MLNNKKNISVHEHDTKIIQLIEKNWGNLEQVVQTKAGHLEQEFILWRRVIMLWVGLYAVTFMIAFFINNDEQLAEYSLIVLVLFFLLSLTSGFVFSRWNSINRKLNKILNPLIFEKVLQILGFTGNHVTEESVTEAEIVNLLDHSELITETRNEYQIDDMVSAEFHGRSLFLSELAVKYVSSSGKKRSGRNVFHGFFVVHDLPRSLEGKTFITTEGDKKGFGNISWWRQKFRTKETPRETLLEWNDFENKLHVATTNEIEARYILTPDFMQELYNWWSERGGNIRISFLDNRLYLLYPDMHVKIGVSTAGFSEKNLKQYLLTVMRPVWHLQHLMKHAESRLHRL
jgi:hypothetical protein